MAMGEPVAKAFTVDMLNSPEVVRNPYPFYDELRGAAPLYGYRDFPPGTVPGVDLPEPSWVVLSHADVSRVAFDHDTFSSRDGLQEQSTAPTLMLVNHDRPEHTRLRKIAAKAFSPAAVQSLGPAVRELVRDTMATFFDQGAPGSAVDVMADYCALLPARVIALVMGVPQDRDRDIRRWATAFMLSADLSATERQECNAAVSQFYTDHVRAQMAAQARGDRSPGDLLNAFIEAEVDGERLTEEEIIRFCVTATVAGAETTSFLLGNLFTVLADEPGVWQALQADRSKFSAVYEETLRYHGPPQRLFRVATRDVEIGHASIRRGDWVACFFGAANYDPDVFPEPYKFKLDRPNGNRQMSFGHGIHRCLGAPLARLEAEMTVLELLDRYEIVRRAAAIRWQGVSLLNHGPERNPLSFVPRAP